MNVVIKTPKLSCLSDSWLRCAYAIFFASVTLLASTSSVIAEETVVNHEESFYDNFVDFFVACHGEPIFIPITEETAIIHINSPPNPETSKREPRMGQMVWLEPNCSFAMIHKPEFITDLTSGQISFGALAFSVGFLERTRWQLTSGNLPAEFSDILLTDEPPYVVKFFTDSNQSGTFDLSEQLPTEALGSDQISWRYTYEDYRRSGFESNFLDWRDSGDSDGFSIEVAEFRGGPLDGRRLYHIVARYKETSRGFTPEK